MSTKRTEKCSVKTCNKQVQSKTIPGFDGSRVIISKLKLDEEIQQYVPTDVIDTKQRMDMEIVYESSDDEEDCLDSILRRLNCA